MARFLCEFFVGGNGVLRPYSNSNVLLDFYRYRDSTYYTRITKYLKLNAIKYDYEAQYTQLHANFTKRPVIQHFTGFIIEDKMPSTKNTKELTLVSDVDGATYKLCTHNYYKYRPINMMFAFHANIIRKCTGFYEFNSLRKNFLLSVGDKIKVPPHSLSKYREYYFHPQFEIG